MSRDLFHLSLSRCALAVVHRGVPRSITPISSTLLFFFLLALNSGLGQTDQPTLHRYTSAPAPADNPLKGFVPFSGTFSFPHSMEYFALPLKGMQKDYEVFDFSKLDQQLNAIAARGHQAVFRPYLDYPNTVYGMPDFLSHVPKNSYTDYGNGTSATSYSPDYSHPDLQRALVSYIKALGNRYDGDPRLGFVKLGLLGFWGEWHTFPYTGFDGKPNWAPSPQVMKVVLDAYTNAFRKTKLVVREPKAGLNFRDWNIGYHDDSFAYTTLPPTDWHFWPRLQQSGLQNIWKTQAIGGEVRPEVQSCMWDLPQGNCIPTGQEYERCVQATHASWMLNQQVFSTTLQGDARLRAIQGAGLLGYSFHVSQAEFQNIIRSSSLTLNLTLTNQGVAPFYYAWPVVTSLRPFSSGFSSSWTNVWDITSILPESPASTWHATYPVTNLAPGRYHLLVSIPSPMKGGKPVRFANSNQDTVVQGWLTLGEVRISSRPVISRGEAQETSFRLLLGSLVQGMPYVVEETETLSPPHWRVVHAFTHQGQGSETTSPAWVMDAQKARYYRVLDAE